MIRKQKIKRINDRICRKTNGKMADSNSDILVIKYKWI